MPGPTRELTDSELLSIAGEVEMRAKLTPAELGRLSKLQGDAETMQSPRTWTDVAVDALPAVGGALGGIVGGIGGTVAGMGVGGVPGAIGGATLGGGAGEAMRQLVNRARGVEAPDTPLEAAKDIGVAGAVNGALEGVGATVGPAIAKGAKAVYRGFLKPSLSARLGPKAGQIVETAIRESLPVTESGAAHAEALIKELNAEVDDVLANTTGTVDLGAVANRLRQWAQSQYNRPGRAASDLEAAMEVANRIDNHPSMAAQIPLAPNNTISAAAANQVKRDVQAGAATAYGVKSGAEKSAEKQGARMLRQDIEAVAPEVGALNARESQLIDAARALRSATGRESNRNAMFGVPTVLAGAAGGGEYARTGDPVQATAMALALRTGMHPAVATRAAILAAKLGAKMPGQAPAAIARAAVQAISEAQQQPEE